MAVFCRPHARDLPIRDGNSIIRNLYMHSIIARDLPIRDGNPLSVSFPSSSLVPARDLPIRDGNGDSLHGMGVTRFARDLPIRDGNACLKTQY